MVRKMLFALVVSRKNATLQTAKKVIGAMVLTLLELALQLCIHNQRGGGSISHSSIIP